jgi:PilZ domain-containing protein
MEHRCGHRRSVQLRVTLRTRSGLVGHGTLTEVSASGARIESQLPLALDSVALVQCRLGGETGASRRITLEAQVVRRTIDGYGLEWTRFAPEEVRMLYASVPEVQGAELAVQTESAPKRRASKRRSRSS